MPKQLILTKLRDAKMAHATWLRKAKSLIDNININEDITPIHSTECTFGTWLYGEGMKLKNMPRATTLLNSIEKEHSNLHQIYYKIYKIILLDTQRNYVSGLFLGSKKKITEEQRKESLSLYMKLTKTSERLVFEVNNFEVELMSTDIDIIKKIVA